MTAINTVSRGIGEQLTHCGNVNCEGCGKPVHDRQHIAVESWPTSQNSYGIGYWHSACFKLKRRKLNHGQYSDRGISKAGKLQKLEAEVRHLKYELEQAHKGKGK